MKLNFPAPSLKWLDGAVRRLMRVPESMEGAEDIVRTARKMRDKFNGGVTSVSLGERERDLMLWIARIRYEALLKSDAADMSEFHAVSDIIKVIEDAELA